MAFNKGHGVNCMFVGVTFKMDLTEYGIIFKNARVRGFAPIGMLECWNNGIMGSGIMQFGVNGKICVEDKIKNG
ncbi:MAG: hypothetical protein C0611_07840 [Desulfobacteraceae bacterium]|nr:MAG: hypothetical protein C0611_07840 [Desulfobacteraceae bacterium]